MLYGLLVGRGGESENIFFRLIQGFPVIVESVVTVVCRRLPRKIVEYVGIFQIQFIVVTTLLRLVIARVYRVVVSEVRERAVGRVVLIPEKQLIAGFIDDAYSCICIDVEIVSYLYSSISPLSVGSFYPIVSCRQYRYRRSFFPGVFPFGIFDIGTFRGRNFHFGNRVDFRCVLHDGRKLFFDGYGTLQRLFVVRLGCCPEQGQ